LLIQVDHVVFQCAGPFESGSRAFAPDEVCAEVVGWPWFCWDNPTIVLVGVVREGKMNRSNEQQQTPGAHIWGRNASLEHLPVGTRADKKVVCYFRGARSICSQYWREVGKAVFAASLRHSTTLSSGVVWLNMADI
jgi:hypothetical protein